MISTSEADTLLDGMLAQVGEMHERLSRVAAINDEYMKRLRKNSHWKNPYLYKTVVCEHWRNGRKCKYGERCWYAHGLHEIRAAQGVGSSQHSPKGECFPSRETSPSLEPFDMGPLMGAYAMPMQPQPFTGPTFKDTFNLALSAMLVEKAPPTGEAGNGLRHKTNDSMNGPKTPYPDTLVKDDYLTPHINGLAPVGSTNNETTHVKAKMEEELCREFDFSFQPFAEGYPLPAYLTPFAGVRECY